VQMDRLGRQRDAHFMLGTLGQRAARFDGLIHHRRQFDPLPLELDPATANAAYVEQIVYEPGHLAQLPVHRGADLLDHVGVAVRSLQDLQHVAERGERPSQFVGQRGQKLVLDAVGVAQRVLRPLPLANVLEGKENQVPGAALSG
jgi:hypothetical protein